MHPAILAANQLIKILPLPHHLQGTSYKTIDAVVKELRPQVAKLMKIYSSNFEDASKRRDEIELTLSWVKWFMGTQFTFAIGPKAARRIASRLRSRDVPTHPVPPAYFEFNEPLLDFSENAPLKGAYLSRGEVGTITFVSAVNSPQTDGSVTVLLPSVMTRVQLEGLKNTRRAQLPLTEDPKLEAHVDALTREMLSNIDPAVGSQPSAVTDYMRSAVRNIALTSNQWRTNGSAQYRIAALAEYDDIVSGSELPDKGSIHLENAAAAILIAADEAKRACRDYAAPQYLNSDAVSRVWIEQGDTPLRPNRNTIIQLP